MPPAAREDSAISGLSRKGAAAPLTPNATFCCRKIILSVVLSKVGYCIRSEAVVQPSSRHNRRERMYAVRKPCPPDSVC